MEKQKYIMVGMPIISKDIFRSVLRPFDNYTFKPTGGFWSSTLKNNAYNISDWFNYLLDERDLARKKDIKHATVFTLKNNAKILEINNPEDIVELSKKYPSYHHLLNFYKELTYRNTIFDFEALSKDYDGVYLNYNKIMCSDIISFDSWSVNSLLLFNLDCIESYITAYINVNIDEDYVIPYIEKTSKDMIVLDHSESYLEIYKEVETLFLELMSKYQIIDFKDYDNYFTILINCAKECLKIISKNRKKTISIMYKKLKEQEIKIEEHIIIRNIVLNYLSDYLNKDIERQKTLTKTIHNKPKSYSLY